MYPTSKIIFNIQVNIRRTKELIFYTQILLAIFFPILHYSQTTYQDYQLVNENGIFVEKFGSNNQDENRFTANNTIFKEGTKFTYSYEHITSDSIRHFFEYDDYGSWRFISPDSISDNTIKEVKIIVKQGLNPMIKYIPDYNQTIIKFNYYSKKEKAPFGGRSGVIENKKNIWIHPPRDRYFGILELNPFPYVRLPLEVGAHWNWELQIGEIWSDYRWKIWSGNILNKYFYRITRKQLLETPLGEIECFVIESTAESRIGKTKLTSYFNTKYGFVKLCYLNIDGSKTNLILEKHTRKETSTE